MKIIYATIIASLLLFGTVLVPNYASAVVCQNKTAIVYGNGMFNEKKDADDSLVELEFRVRTYPQASSLLAELEFHLAYADNAGATDPWSLTGVGQVVEVMRQGGNNTYVSMWRWLSGIEATPQWFQNDMTRIAAAQNAFSYVNDVDLQKMLNGDGTANNPGYRKLLLDGKRVLIVSHSQGNFYANAVYNTLNDPLNPRYANNMGNVQVATPASYVASGGPYTTVPEDAAMAFVIGKLAPSDPVSFQSYNLLPYSLKVSPNFVNLGYAAWATASKGHSFINWYLAWSYTRDRIMGHIVKTISGVNGVGGLQYPTQGCTVTSSPAVSLSRIIIDTDFYDQSNTVDWAAGIAYDTYYAAGLLRVSRTDFINETTAQDVVDLTAIFHDSLGESLVGVISIPNGVLAFFAITGDITVNANYHITVEIVGGMGALSIGNIVDTTSTFTTPLNGFNNFLKRDKWLLPAELLRFWIPASGTPQQLSEVVPPNALEAFQLAAGVVNGGSPGSSLVTIQANRVSSNSYDYVGGSHAIVNTRVEVGGNVYNGVFEAVTIDSANLMNVLFSFNLSQTPSTSISTQSLFNIFTQYLADSPWGGNAFPTTASPYTGYDLGGLDAASTVIINAGVPTNLQAAGLSQFARYRNINGVGFVATTSAFIAITERNLSGGITAHPPVRVATMGFLGDTFIVRSAGNNYVLDTNSATSDLYWILYGAAPPSSPNAIDPRI